MDFRKYKSKQKHKANFKNPWMGIDGQICKQPVYWCRLHEVWLSETDVEKKKCLNRLTFDMLSVRKCNCLEKKDENPFLKGEKH